ncbi:MAG: hypothetical protein CL489_08990 [Acidobacteria bacterium]|nr:hypothetical protein [Acidobacteriota bacterium]|tara:strand:- start:32746 stop:33123 length:378 start_codon:yes stop_codon:yes gene_type:complete
MERNYQRKHAVHRTNKDYWRDQNDQIIRQELEEMTCEDFESLYNSNCSVERETKGDDMNKLERELKVTKLVKAARKAAEAESNALDDFLGGAISEECYLHAMERTKEAVEHAVANGVSYKDLPAV